MGIISDSEKNSDIQTPKLNYLENALHDMKSPLSIIYSTIQLMEESNKIHPALVKYCQSIRSQCVAMLHLLDEVNGLKMEIIKSSKAFKNADIVGFVENIVSMSQPLVVKRGIELIFDTDVEEKIMAIDSYSMERIILNLVSNSIKYTPSGGKIKVSVTDCDDKVRISVIDSGLGIDPDFLVYIFDRYESLGIGSNNSTGLGLSIVKEMVTKLGGTIEAKSRGGFSGLEMVFEIPAFLIDEESGEDYDIRNFLDN